MCVCVCVCGRAERKGCYLCQLRCSWYSFEVTNFPSTCQSSLQLGYSVCKPSICSRLVMICLHCAHVHSSVRVLLRMEMPRSVLMTHSPHVVHACRLYVILGTDEACLFGAMWTVPSEPSEGYLFWWEPCTPHNLNSWTILSLPPDRHGLVETIVVSTTWFGAVWPMCFLLTISRTTLVLLK